MTTKKKNLANPQLKEVMEALSEGKTPPKGKQAVKRLYKHPVKNRTIFKSTGQRDAIRRG